MLQSDKSIYALNGTTLAKLLRQDPKVDVRSLASKVTFYEVNKNGTHPQWVLERYHKKLPWSSIVSHFIKCYLFFLRSLKNDIIRLGADLEKPVYGNYVGKEQLFSFGYSYLVPKVSPIKARSNLQYMLKL